MPDLRPGFGTAGNGRGDRIETRPYNAGIGREKFFCDGVDTLPASKILKKNRKRHSQSKSACYTCTEIYFKGV